MQIWDYIPDKKSKILEIVWIILSGIVRTKEEDRKEITIRNNKNL